MEHRLDHMLEQQEAPTELPRVAKAKRVAHKALLACARTMEEYRTGRVDSRMYFDHLRRWERLRRYVVELEMGVQP
jgi:hypothetical protein